jgi:hypothetical protein
VLGKPDSTVAEPVGEHDLLDALIEGAPDTCFGQVRGFEFEEQAYVHT